MNPNELLNRALAGKPVPRVPTWFCILDTPMIKEILGLPHADIRSKLEGGYLGRALDRRAEALNRVLTPFEWVGGVRYFARVAEAAIREGFDSTLVFFPWPMFLESREELFDPFGRAFRMQYDEFGDLVMPTYHGGLIEDPAGYDRWPHRPDPRLTARFARQYFAHFKRKYGRRIHLMGQVGYGFWEHYWQIIGFEPAMEYLITKPAFVHRVISDYKALYTALMDAMLDAGIRTLFFGDDLAFKSGPMISPAMIDEYLAPAYRRITARAHARGAQVLLHSCGNNRILWDRFADWGFDGMHALEPTSGGCLKEAKEVVGDRICLVGNIDIHYTLTPRATVEDVEEAVRASIEAAAPGYGYILGPAHTHPGLSVRNIRAMRAACKKYGGY